MAGHNSLESRLLIASQWENGAVQVSVADCGSGIPEEKMQQILERFFTTKKEGMGLGLSVCRTIINAHRGKIWATNNVGRGATFHFSLAVTSSVRGKNGNRRHPLVSSVRSKNGNRRHPLVSNFNDPLNTPNGAKE